MKVSIAKEVISNNEQIVDSLIYLSDEEYNNFNKNIEIINKFTIIESYFQIVYRNFNDFTSCIKENSAELLKNSSSPLILNCDYLNSFKIDSNRKFLNYLSSFRTLIDHIPSHLEKSQKDELNDFLNLLYDQEFVYRFFYKLRNYTQHCGLPITKYVSNFDNSLVEIFLKIEAQQLLKNYKSWSIVKDDLEKYDDIDSKSIIKDHFTLVRKIFFKTLYILKSDFKNSVKFIETNIQKYLGNHKLMILIETDNGDLHSYSYIPLEKINTMKKLYNL